MWTKLYCYSSSAACPLPESKQFIPISVAPTYLSTPHPPPPHSHPTRHSESAGCPSNLTFFTFNHSQTLKCVTNMLIKQGIEKFKELLESLSFLKKILKSPLYKFAVSQYVCNVCNQLSVQACCGVSKQLIFPCPFRQRSVHRDDDDACEDDKSGTFVRVIKNT